MTYSCFIEITVVLKDAEQDFEMAIDLPFVPVKGMPISIGPAKIEDDRIDDSDMVDVEPRHIRYIHGPGCDVFWVYATINNVFGCSCKRGDGCCVWTDETVTHYLNAGFKLQGERRTGKKRHHKFKGMFK